MMNVFISIGRLLKTGNEVRVVTSSSFATEAIDCAGIPAKIEMTAEVELPSKVEETVSSGRLSRRAWRDRLATGFVFGFCFVGDRVCSIEVLKDESILDVGFRFILLR